MKTIKRKFINMKHKNNYILYIRYQFNYNFFIKEMKYNII